MVDPLTREQIELAKQKQKDVIVECDSALADLKQNIDTLQALGVQQKKKRADAQKVLDKLEGDFPTG